MMLISRIRALCERMRLTSMKKLAEGTVQYRRPIIRVAVGGALMLPAAAMMANGQLDSMNLVRTSVAEDATDPNTDEVVRQWSERMLERERELVIASFAREYRIPETLAESIHAAAVEARVSPKMAFGLVKAESSFRTAAVSPVGAVGLTQVMPATARWLVPGTTRRDLMDTETNLRIGFKYLRQLLDSYDGDEMLALTAYNRGPGTVGRLLSRGADPDNGYAEKVLTGSSAKHVALMNAKFGPKRPAPAKRPARRR